MTTYGPNEAGGIVRYPTDCPCGSRCDGHAAAAPEDPGLEWDGRLLPPDLCVVCFEDDCGCPEGPTTEEMRGRKVVIIEETRYSDRSPREGWEAAWRVHRATR